jgi:hypothetical protein
MTGNLAMNKSIRNNLAFKITALWTVFLLGTLFHTQLALMPLFHGVNVAQSHTHGYVSMDFVMWFMLIFFVLPLWAIVGCAFSPNLRFYRLHFVMSLVYTVLNLAHLVVDVIIAVPGYQLVLMLLLLLIGLLINWVAYSAYTWIKTNPKPQDSFNSLSSGV